MFSQIPLAVLISYHKINTGDQDPVRTRPYLLSPAKRRTLNQQIDEMLTQGIIRESHSSWRSSPVLVPKSSTAEFRFAIDFRKLNRISETEIYPLPKIENIFNSLHGAKVFTKLDLKAAFWQSMIDPNDCQKTAFAIEGRERFEFVRLPLV